MLNQYKNKLVRQLTGITMDKMTNSKTRRKHIRFPHLLIDQIEESMKSENIQNFSAWVVEACRLKAREAGNGKK